MLSLYNASKFALEGWSESIAFELGSQNIGVKLVEPHGGVSATSFPERTAKEFALDPALGDYDEFVARTKAAYARMGSVRMINSGDVARVIHQATTDGKDQLRYLVGIDDRGFIKAWQTMTTKTTPCSSGPTFPGKASSQQSPSQTGRAFLKWGAHGGMGPPTMQRRTPRT